MAEPVRTFDLEIRPSTLVVSSSIPPNGEAEVTFQVSNTGDCRIRAEAVLEPLEGPAGRDDQGSWAHWLQLIEPPEYDYQPRSQRSYTVKIKVGNMVNQGQYRFRLLLVGHEDPDHECLASDEVQFNIAVPPYNSRPLVIGGVILLVLVLIGIGFAIWKPWNRTSSDSVGTTGMKADLSVPDSFTVGEPAEYVLTVTNGAENPAAENVVLDYSYPAGVVSAWAKLDSDSESQTILYCGSTDKMLRCVMGTIAPRKKVALQIYVLPGPQTDGTKIKHQDQFILRWMQGDEYMDNNTLTKRLPSPVKEVASPSETPVSGAAIPVMNMASVGLPVKVKLVGWNNKQADGPVQLKYSLPKEGGMRFASYDPVCGPEGTDYWTLVCNGQGQVKVDVQVIPLQPSTGYPLVLSGSETTDGVYQELISPSLPAANNQLAFNGIDDWVQLGTSSVPEKFTVEMWVNPSSLEDGQALIGAHRLIPGSQEVLNRFLVGYYNGSINVNVMGRCRNIDLSKTAGPFHLAVVVENQGKNVTVYKDNSDSAVPLQEPICCMSDCNSNWKVDKDRGEADFNWVIGQDWDANGSAIAASDFYHGAISDVRIYSGALTAGQVNEDMYLPPPLCKPDNECDRPELIGWWPLAKTTRTAAGQQVECTLPKEGNLNAKTAGSACTLVDLGPGHYDGARSGSSAENLDAHFGDALAFDGRSGVYNTQDLLSSFQSKTKGVPVTISTWVYVDAVPSQQQTFLALNSEKMRVSLAIASNGHGQAIYDEKGGATWIVTDLNTIPAGRWTQYAVVLWFNKGTGELSEENGERDIWFFRDGRRVRTDPMFTPALKLTSVPSPIPTPTSTPAIIPNVVLEAENASFGGGVTVDHNHYNFRENGFINFPNDNGFLQFSNVDGGSGGSRSIEFRYALAAGSRTGLLIVNGESQLITFDSTTSWDNWMTKHVKVTLNRETNNTIVLMSKGEDLANIDELIVGPSEPTIIPTNTPIATLYPVRQIGNGFYLGGSEIFDNECTAACFTGQIDEVRIWNRALYERDGSTGYIAPEIDSWRRLPGVTFDESVYWSFDNHTKNEAQGICVNKDNCPTLIVNGPAWVPNDLSIGYTK